MESPSNSKAKMLLQTARELFFRYGMRRVSIEEICKKARVSKMTFYKYFRNKDDIVIHLLEEISTEQENRTKQIMAKDIPIEEKVKQITLLKMQSAGESSIEFYNDLMLNIDSEPGKFIVRKQQEWDETIKKFYKDAQKKGEIRRDINIDFLMYMVDHLRDLAQNKDLQSIYPDFSQLVKEIMSFFFYGVVNK